MTSLGIGVLSALLCLIIATLFAVLLVGKVQRDLGFGTRAALAAALGPSSFILIIASISTFTVSGANLISTFATGAVFVTYSLVAAFILVGWPVALAGTYLLDRLRSSEANTVK